MSPALVRLGHLKPGESSTSFPTRKAGTMHIQSILHPRSTDGGGRGGIQVDTIIFIVVGIVCLVVILIGFYFVSRHHAASRASRGAPSSHPEHSPTAAPPGPRRKRSMSEYWKIWKPWHHSSPAATPAKPAPTIEVPTLQIPSTPVTLSPITPARAMTHPLMSSRPSQARRVTSLSVTTSFSHSHITQEELNNFRISAYDLDGDLETEMLNSAREDLWSGHALAVEEAMEALEKGDYTVDGGVQRCSPTTPCTPPQGGDHEDSATCQNTATVCDGVQGDEVKAVEIG